VGSEGAQMVRTMISYGSTAASDIVTGLVGALTLLFGASGVFTELHESLDKLWEAKERTDQGFWSLLRERFLSFGMVLVIGFLLVVSLLLSSALSATGSLFEQALPAFVLQGINFLATAVIMTLLFAAIYRFLPSERLPWNDLWVGAFGTSIALVSGKFLLGFYLGRANVGSAYGAAGSLILLLVWIYYASQIFFFGAEFTQAYARRHGSLLSGRSVEASDPEVASKAADPPVLPERSPSKAGLPARGPVHSPSRHVAPANATSKALALAAVAGWAGFTWWRERQRRSG
jgi:membrane protein